MTEKQKREIIVRAFCLTGKDHEEGLLEYIALLERTAKKLHKKAGNRRTITNDIELIIAWTYNNV